MSDFLNIVNRIGALVFAVSGAMTIIWWKDYAHASALISWAIWLYLISDDERSS